MVQSHFELCLISISFVFIKNAKAEQSRGFISQNFSKPSQDNKKVQSGAEDPCPIPPTPNSCSALLPKDAAIADDKTKEDERHLHYPTEAMSQSVRVQAALAKICPNKSFGREKCLSNKPQMYNATALGQN